MAVLNPNGTRAGHPRPPFCVVTTFLGEEETADAEWLGLQLYDLLTRKRDDPLAFGAGIPVAIAIDLDRLQNQDLDFLGDDLLVIVVAGTTSLLLESERSRKRIAALANRLTSSVQPWKRNIWILPMDQRWQREAGALHPAKMSTAILRERNLQPIDAALLEIGEYFLGQNRPELYISRPIDREIPNRIGHDPLSPSSALWSYFSQVKRVPDAGLPRLQRPDRGTASGVLVSIREKQQNGRTSWQRDVISAKRLGWPVISISVPQGGSRKDSAYTGNVTSIEWTSDIDSMLRLVVVEHIRDSHFRRAASRMVDLDRLPINTVTMCRAPELMDLNSGVLSHQSTRMVLHPDPALPPADREILRDAAPQIQPITPSTVLGRNAQRRDEGGLASPLDGVRIGLSVSDISSGDFRAGQTSYHLEDATIQLARSLISGGAGITYGGDFSLGRVRSFTPLLAEIVQSYNQTFGHLEDKLCLFQTANLPLEDFPETLNCRVRHLGRSKDLIEKAVIPPSQRDRVPTSLLVSDMRRAMIAETDVRIAIGGQSFPRGDEGEEGYSGRFPGVVEEVFLALNHHQPVYLCGGSGGAARRLARVLQSPDDLDEFWHENTLNHNRRFVRLCWDVDHHPDRPKLKLPSTLRELVQSIAKFFLRLGDDDCAWQAWNGLDRRQNLLLGSTTDPSMISSLVCEGLSRWRTSRLKSNGMLQIEAIRGDVVSISAADLLVLPVFSDVDLQGAGAAVDAVTGGLVSQGRDRPGRIVAVRQDELDVDYLCVVSLGEVTGYGKGMQNQAKLRSEVADRVTELIELCRRENFRTIALVTFAGSTLTNYENAVDSVLDGLTQAGSELTVKWVEQSTEKYATLVETIRRRGSVSLTTLTQPPSKTETSFYPWFHLTVKWIDGMLDVTALPAQGTGLAWSHRVPLTRDQLESYSRGRNGSDVTPQFQEVNTRGTELARLIFADHAGELVAADPDVSVAITHDEESSRLPFEILKLTPEASVTDSPSCRGGVHRLLAVDHARVSSLFARPRLTRRLRIGIVINPTGDLPGASVEGESLIRNLSALSSDVHRSSLNGTEATLDAVCELLTQVDVLHFCGHAAFDAHNPAAAGLQLTDGQVLTASHLSEVHSLPRVVVLNACQAARVRGDSANLPSGAYSLAAMLLRSGVEAFVGTFWQVDDAAAADFSASVYQSLTAGETLRASVTRARRLLAERKHADWGNYILYGDGRFQLM